VSWAEPYGTSNNFPLSIVRLSNIDLSAYEPGNNGGHPKGTDMARFRSLGVVGGHDGGKEIYPRKYQSER
jgi:hypothetical protein